jgi:hypothetical protein
MEERAIKQPVHIAIREQAAVRVLAALCRTHVDGRSADTACL